MRDRFAPACELLRNMENERAPVAFLLPRAPAIAGGWRWGHYHYTHRFGELLAEAPVPFDVVMEHEFTAEGLSRYAYLVAPMLSALTREQSDALEAAAGLDLFEELGMPLLRQWIPSVEACGKGLAEGWHAPEPGYAFDHSHAWGGTPAWQLPVRLLGLRILEPGFRRIELAPNLCGLDRADIVLPTPLGLLRAKLRAGREPQIELPPGLDATVSG